MNLSAPTQLVFVISLVLGIVGILGKLAIIPGLITYGFWMIVIAWLLLVLGSVLKGI